MATHKTKDSAAFCFRRDELLNSITERAAWGADRRERLNAALDVVSGKLKKASTKITLTKDQAEMIRQALADYDKVDEAFLRAGIHVRGLLAVIEEAGKTYREGERSAAAKTLGWTTGRRGPTEDHDSIIGTYLFHIGCGRSKEQALDFIVSHFGLHSKKATITLLKRAKKHLPSLPLPNTWPRIARRKK